MKMKCLVLRTSEHTRWGPRKIFREAAKAHTHPDKVEAMADFFYHQWLFDERLELFVANHCTKLLKQKSIL